MEIVTQKIGAEGEIDVKIEGGQLIIEGSQEGADGGVSLKSHYALAKVGGKLIDALVGAAEKAIPGDQTAAASFIEQYLKDALAKLG